MSCHVYLKLLNQSDDPLGTIQGCGRLREKFLLELTILCVSYPQTPFVACMHETKMHAITICTQVWLTIHCITICLTDKDRILKFMNALCGTMNIYSEIILHSPASRGLRLSSLSEITLPEAKDLFRCLKLSRVFDLSNGTAILT